jgi:hypothetical protein
MASPTYFNVVNCSLGAVLMFTFFASAIAGIAQRATITQTRIQRLLLNFVSMFPPFIFIDNKNLHI